ncbi:virion structural protein [Vibrio phage vB_VpaM_sm033]|nr:virion structural protein [Vibrio phage vB_VpaM_sm033]
MPLYNDDEVPEVPQQEEEVIVRDTATVYEGQTKTDDIPPLHITEIQGNPWTVETFYSQYLGADDYPRRFDPSLSRTLQQYLATRNLVLKTTSELSFELDEDVITTLSGTANVYPGIIVNQWDMFVARVKDGRRGLFTVNELPRPLTYLSYTAYEINYQLVEWIKDDTFEKLEAKVVKTLYFNPDNPLCPTDNLVEITSRETIIQRIIKYVDLYYSYFFDRRNRTFTFDDEGTKTYDNAVVEFMNNMVPNQARHKTRHPRADKFDVPSIDYHRKSKTIYDILLDNELNLLPIVDKEYCISSSAAFYSVFVMHSILMTDIAGVWHPSGMRNLESGAPVKGTYIFSDGFYKEKPEGTFETLIYKALNGEAIDFQEVDEEVELHFSESSMSDLYRFMPIYIWLYVRLL